MRAPSRAMITGMALGLGALGLYLATLSRWYSADSLEFALEIEVPGEHDAFDPHHLLLNPLSALWLELSRLAGWSGRGIEALEALNAIAGAACVAAVFAIAVRACADPVAAALASAGCAVAGGMWLLSTEAEGVTPGLAVHLGALAALLTLRRGEPRTRKAAAAIGAAIAAAAATYLTGAFLFAVAVLAVWQGRADNHAWKRAVLWLLVGFAALIPAAVIVRMVLQGSWQLDAAPFAVSLGGGRYGLVSWENVPRGVYAFLRTLVLFPGIGINDRTLDLLASSDNPRRAMWLFTYVAAAVVAAVPLVLFWRFRRQVDRDWRRRLLLWAMLYAAFAFWWVPSDISFWAPLLAGWWIIVAVVVARGALPRLAAALTVALLFAINGLGLIWPHHDASRNVPLQLTLALDRQLAADDRILTSPQLSVFLRYIARRPAQRIDGEPEFRQAVASARAAQARTGGRIVVVDLRLDEAQRAEWQAVLLGEINGTRVWELAGR